MCPSTDMLKSTKYNFCSIVTSTSERVISRIARDEEILCMYLNRFWILASTHCQIDRYLICSTQKLESPGLSPRVGARFSVGLPWNDPAFPSVSLLVIPPIPALVWRMGPKRGDRGEDCCWFMNVGLFGMRMGCTGMLYLTSSSSMVVFMWRMKAVRRPHRPPQSCQLGRSTTNFVETSIHTRGERELTLNGNDQPDGILELHFIDIEIKASPLSVVLGDICSKTVFELLQDIQWGVIWDHQIGSFPPTQYVSQYIKNGIKSETRTWSYYASCCEPVWY